MTAPKVILNNRCRGRAKIEYIEKSKQGPEHKPLYTCEVQVNGTTWGRGVGPTKKEAENAAADNAVAWGDANGAFNVFK